MHWARYQAEGMEPWRRQNYEIKLMKEAVYFFRNYESLVFICICPTALTTAKPIAFKNPNLFFKYPQTTQLRQKKSKRKTTQMPCLAHKHHFTFSLSYLFYWIKYLFFEIRANWDNYFYLTNTNKSWTVKYINARNCFFSLNYKLLRTLLYQKNSTTAKAAFEQTDFKLTYEAFCYSSSGLKKNSAQL